MNEPGYGDACTWGSPTGHPLDPRNEGCAEWCGEDGCHWCCPDDEEDG